MIQAHLVNASDILADEFGRAAGRFDVGTDRSDILALLRTLHVYDNPFLTSRRRSSDVNDCNRSRQQVIFRPSDVSRTHSERQRLLVGSGTSNKRRRG